MDTAKHKKEPLIVLTGPTAVGKTKLSIALAKAVDGEIISADSMQVYKAMDIGTAKIMPDEMRGIKHHLIDVLEPEDDFNVVLFQQMANEAIREIRSRGKVPILVGGTGFYIQSVTNAILPTAASCLILRRSMERRHFTHSLPRRTRRQLHRFMKTISSGPSAHSNTTGRPAGGFRSTMKSRGCIPPRMIYSILF